MKNEIELSDIYFDKREIPTRRELWNKIEELQSQLAEKCNIIEHQHYGIEYWKSVAEKRPDFDYIVKIKDLEQQLAEKEDELNSARVGEQFALKCCNEAKEQLAEKEREIKKLKSENHALISDNAYQEADIFELNSFKEYYKNNKISFAIEQLEKVKEKLLEELDNVTELLDPLEYEDYHEFIGCGRGYKNSIEEIDNQIKQLKEGK